MAAHLSRLLVGISLGRSRGLVDLVSEGVEASRGTVREGSVGVSLGNLLVALLGGPGGVLLDGLRDVVDGVRSGVLDGLEGRGGGGRSPGRMEEEGGSAR